MAGNESGENPRSTTSSSSHWSGASRFLWHAMDFIWYNVFTSAWRTINWQKRASELQAVKNFHLLREDQQMRILLYGPIGAGKSSFINTVESVLRGRKCIQAPVDRIFSQSFTTKYRTYRIPRKDGSLYPFIFSDMMGLEDNPNTLVEDVKLALRGHVRERYEFSRDCQLSEGSRFYNSAPTNNDKVHVLVCVFPADISFPLSDNVVRMIREIRLEARDLEIPQVAILTKIDLICPELERNLKNVYKVAYLKNKMEEFSCSTGFPMDCIFPVKNYHENLDLNNETDSLVLSALKKIIDFGEDNILRAAQEFSD